jgi:hypothetical protein
MRILEQTEAFERVVELVSERSECCGCAADHLQALASQCEEHWVGESGAGRGSRMDISDYQGSEIDKQVCARPTTGGGGGIVWVLGGGGCGRGLRW